MTYRPAPWTLAPRRPGAATSAAVLAFVEAGLGIAVQLGMLAVPGSPTPATSALLLTTPVITALLLVGSFSVLRGSGRRLLLGTSIGEIAFVLGLAAWSSVDPAGPYALATGSALLVSVAVSVVFGTALPVVRSVLLVQPAVRAWLRARPSAWYPPRTGIVAALLAPVALLMAGSIWLVASPGQVDYTVDVQAAAPIDWDVLYDGGTPVTPPAEDHPAYDEAFDSAARQCHDGDMTACDELWLDTPPGSLYEWLGSTCGGRESRGTYGFCA